MFEEKKGIKRMDFQKRIFKNDFLKKKKKMYFSRI